MEECLLKAVTIVIHIDLYVPAKFDTRNVYQGAGQCHMPDKLELSATQSIEI